MTDTDIKEAMHLMYRKILVSAWMAEDDMDPTGFLLRILASVVYHSDWLLEQSATTSGHPFLAIPILVQDEALLSRLKEKVTTDSTESMPIVTGVPPHVEQSIKLRKLLVLCTDVLNKVNDMHMAIKESIFAAFEERALENGHMTRTQLNKIFSEFKVDITTNLMEQLNSCFGPATGQNRKAPETRNSNEQQNVSHQLFNHRGRLWHIPQNSAFPSGTKRELGWKLWLKGMPNYTATVNGERKQYCIHPFKFLDPKMLPKKIADTFKLQWQPIYSMMMEGLVDEVVPDNQVATDYLKEKRVRYIWDDAKKKQDHWTVSTWSKYIKCSTILKDGTDSDKANLPEATRFNWPHSNRKQTAPLARTDN